MNLKTRFFKLFFFTDRQSTPASYEHYTRESLTDGEAAIQKSENLRSTLNAMYINSVKDLRDQASRVDLVLGEKINLTEEVRLQLEKELLRVSIVYFGSSPIISVLLG